MTIPSCRHEQGPKDSRDSHDSATPPRQVRAIVAVPMIVLSIAALAFATRTHAVQLDVPGTHATLQAAVAAAAISIDVDNVITLSASPLVSAQTVSLGAAFGPARRLVIRPADGLTRASIVCNAPGVVIIAMAGAGNVTLQSLDILRNVTNGQHLVTISSCSDVTIERCRIGSNSPTTGTAGWANVWMAYPTQVLLTTTSCSLARWGLSSAGSMP